MRTDVEPRTEFPSSVTLIPCYPDLPMEDVFPRVPRTQIRELYLCELGKSRIVYFPWDIDRTFWEVLSLDHGRLLRNAVEWATNEERPATVTGQGVLDVSVWRQKESITVHLVNLTNPMTMKGPFRELIPLVSQEVKVRLPEGKKARKVQLLVSGSVPRTSTSAQMLTVSVPSILDHEVVAIRFVMACPGPVIPAKQCHLDESDCPVVELKKIIRTSPNAIVRNVKNSDRIPRRSISGTE